MHIEEIPEEHRYYFSLPPLPLQAPLFTFTHREREILETQGQWMKALAEGAILPTTPLQTQFVAVANGLRRAQTAYERLWVRYQHYHPPKAPFQQSVQSHRHQIDFIAIDFETANRERGSACSIGIARVEQGSVQETLHFLIRPEPFYFEKGNIRVHGIHPEDVQHAPDFAELYPKLLPYLENQLVVAHNAQFDMGVLRTVLKFYDLPLPRMRYACTFQAARKAVRRLPRYGLAHLSQHYAIELNHHHAESDASACAQVLVNLCREKDAHTLEEFFEKCQYTPKVLR